MAREHWASLSYKNDPNFGERVFVNMPYRAHFALASRLTMWISPVDGLEDRIGAWSFFARSGGVTLSESEAAELLAGFYVLLSGHGFEADAMSFKTLAAIAQRPQHHIPDKYLELAKKHLKRQRELERELERERAKHHHR